MVLNQDLVLAASRKYYLPSYLPGESPGVSGNCAAMAILVCKDPPPLQTFFPKSSPKLDPIAGSSLLLLPAALTG